MAKSLFKYYAVRVGRNPGIYTSWSLCKQQIIGFSNPLFKMFEGDNQVEVLKACNEFMTNNTTNSSTQGLLNNEWKKHMDDETYAFVDGSFNAKTNVYGYGGFISHKNQTAEKRDITYIKGFANDVDMVSMRNVAGEICGSQKAVEKAIELGYPSITILHDYVGISKWPNDEWKTNKIGTQNYAKYIKSVKDKIAITFVKVAGHTNIPGNEEADRLAKESVGLTE